MIVIETVTALRAARRAQQPAQHIVAHNMYAHSGIMGQTGRCVGGIGHLPPLSAGHALPGVRSARCKSDVNWVVCDHGVARCGGCHSCRFRPWPTTKASPTPIMGNPSTLEGQSCPPWGRDKKRKGE